MDRNTFISKIESKIKTTKNAWISEKGYVSIHVYSPEELNLEEGSSAWIKKLEQATETSWINTPSSLLKLIPDYLLMEDEEYEGWIYTLEFNPHEIYDSLKTPSESQTLWRLADTEDTTGVFGLLHLPGLGNTISPYEDSEIGKIFKSNPASDGYSKNWCFACQNKEDLLAWIGEYDLEKLHEKGVKLWKLELPKNQIIHGERQSIYLANSVLFKTSISLLKIHDKPTQTTLNKTNTNKML